VHADPTDVIAANLTLARVQPGTHLNTQRLHRIANCHGPADRSLRAVELELRSSAATLSVSLK